MAEGGYLPPVVARLAADISDLQRGLATARAEMRGTADDGGRSFERLKSVGTAALHALVIGSVAAGGALAAIGGFGLKAAAEMQQTEVAFTGIFGSASAANAFLGELKTFAARTPFEFPELATAAKQLMATGTAAADVIPVMTKIGNVASTLGVGAEGIQSVVRALGQIQGKGKASLEELNQIGEAIPGFSAIKSIAEGMGVSVAEAMDKVSAGAVPAGDAVRYILAGMEKFPGAAGAMERQSATLLGVWSTMKDTLRDNLIAGLQPIIPLISTTLNNAQGVLGTSIAQIATSLGGLAPVILSLLQAILPIASTILAAFGQIFTEAGARVGAILTKIAPYIDRLLEALLPLIGAFLELASDAILPLLPALLTLITQIASGLLPVVNALSPIVSAVAQAFSNLINRLSTAGVFDTIAKVLGLVLEAVVPLAKEVGGALLDALNELVPVLPELADAFIEIVRALIPVLPSLTELLVLSIRLTAAIAPVVAMIGADLVRVLASILRPLASSKELVYLVVGAMVAWKAVLAGAWLFGFARAIVTNVIPALYAQAAAGWAAMAPWIPWIALAAAVVAAAYLIATNFDAVWSAVKAGVQAVVNFITSHWDEALRVVLAIVTGGMSEVVLFIARNFDEIIGFVAALPGRIASFGGALFNGAIGLGRAVIDGIRNGIEAGVGALGEVVGSIGDGLVNVVRWAWNSFADTVNSFIPNSINMPWPLPDIDLPNNPIPRLASGAAVFGPMLAIVGDNPNASTDPELIAPESRIRSVIAGELDRRRGGDTNVVVVIVRSEEEALEYVPEAARAKTRAKFLEGRRSA